MCRYSYMLRTKRMNVLQSLFSFGLISAHLQDFIKSFINLAKHPYRHLQFIQLEAGCQFDYGADSMNDLPKQSQNILKDINRILVPWQVMRQYFYSTKQEILRKDSRIHDLDPILSRLKKLLFSKIYQQSLGFIKFTQGTFKKYSTRHRELDEERKKQLRKKKQQIQILKQEQKKLNLQKFPTLLRVHLFRLYRNKHLTQKQQKLKSVYQGIKEAQKEYLSIQKQYDLQVKALYDPSKAEIEKWLEATERITSEFYGAFAEIYFVKQMIIGYKKLIQQAQKRRKIND